MRRDPPDTLFDTLALFATGGALILAGVLCLCGSVAAVVWVGRWIAGG